LGLNRAGLNPAQIARYLGLNHSTVVHGLARAEQHPEWRALVAPAIQQVSAGGEARSSEGLAHARASRGAAAGTPLDQRLRHLHHFGLGAPFGSSCAYGLWLVLRRPWYRTAVRRHCAIPDWNTKSGASTSMPLVSATAAS